MDKDNTCERWTWKRRRIITGSVRISCLNCSLRIECCTWFSQYYKYFEFIYLDDDIDFRVISNPWFTFVVLWLWRQYNFAALTQQFYLCLMANDPPIKESLWVFYGKMSQLESHVIICSSQILSFRLQFESQAMTGILNMLSCFFSIFSTNSLSAMSFTTILLENKSL